MPKVIDHEVRRRDLAEALWRVVARDGIHQVSVRAIAAEAGNSPSALRHYFATQDELLGFAMESMVERIASRIRPMMVTVTGRTSGRAVLEQLLPMDAARRAEVQVYLAFVVRAGVDPALRAIRDDAEEASRRVVGIVVQGLRNAGELGAGRSVRTEAAQLYPLVDGLALHGAMWPERYGPAHLRRTLTRALERLAEPVA